MRVSKRLDLGLLVDELAAASVPINGLNLLFDPGSGPTGPTYDGNLLTYSEDGFLVDLPPAAVPVVDAHVAPPRVIDYAGAQTVDTVTRTTDALDHEVFRFPCDPKHVYRASMVITGVDAVSGAIKVMDGRFVWKRWAAGAIMTGIAVVSDIHDTAAASWAPNALPQGNDIVFTVRGAAGRTIDWLLVGEVSQYAPEGLSTS